MMHLFVLPAWQGSQWWRWPFSIGTLSKPLQLEVPPPGSDVLNFLEGECTIYSIILCISDHPWWLFIKLASHFVISLQSSVYTVLVSRERWLKPLLSQPRKRRHKKIKETLKIKISWNLHLMLMGMHIRRNLPWQRRNLSCNYGSS